MKRLLGIGLALGLLAVGCPLNGGASPTEEQKIEETITAVIDAYRSGDYAAMGRYYAPEVTMVPGDYNPPLSDWTQVEQRYRQASASLTGVAMTRENTRIVRRGKLAWAVYQWRYAAFVGTQTVGAQGHTTLVLEKRGGKWLILHNHTSALPPSCPSEKPAAVAPPSF